MIEIKEIRVPARNVRSLVWRGDILVDWVGGGRQFTFGGEVGDARVFYAYGFDAAVESPSGDLSVIYTRLGTKGLVLRRGQVLREINRSYYFADSYEYPIALVRLQTGSEAVIHCPDHYNQLEIDDLATGERLTGSISRKPSDCFHSRLACSLDGTHMVSAGWLWHPIDEVRLYDLAAALADPCHLDGKGLGIEAWAEDGSSAAFLPDGRLAIDLVEIETNNDAENAPKEGLRLIDPSRPLAPEVIHRTGRLGTMMAVGTQYLLGPYEHPKLIDLETGEVVRSWPHINSGAQTSSILNNSPSIPPIALDPLGRRCAIADAEGINVLEFF
jgi:hypothetical protein